MKVKVRLDTLSDIKGFVNAVSPIATEVHLTDGNNLTVSAKSIFRKYFNLNDWMLHNCSPLNTDDPYEVVVSKDNLDALQQARRARLLSHRNGEQANERV